jgi:hypothetical protein
LKSFSLNICEIVGLLSFSCYEAWFLQKLVPSASLIGFPVAKGWFCSNISPPSKTATLKSQNLSVNLLVQYESQLL